MRLKQTTAAKKWCDQLNSNKANNLHTCVPFQLEIAITTNLIAKHGQTMYGK